jgi:hypothetical protein
MDGGSGNDYLDGDKGDDRLNGADGWDICFGDKGNDTILNCEWPPNRHSHPNFPWWW